jgi:hypothetical protein
MIQKNATLALLLAAAAAFLAGCGSKDTEAPVEPAPKAQKFDEHVVGAWTPKNATGDVYEFYASPTQEPYIGEKTGRIYSAGNLKNFFNWEIQADGTLKMTLYSSSCADRPISTCAVTGTGTVAATGDALLPSSLWKIGFDDNRDGVVDRQVSDTYSRKDLDLSGLAQGEFFLTRSEQFDYSYKGGLSGKKLSIRISDYPQPIFLTGDIPTGKVSSLALDGGQPVVTPDTFDVPGMGKIQLPVKLWIDNAQIMAAANGGWIVQFDLHRQIQLPGPVDPSMQPAIAAYEKVQKKSRSMGLIGKFIQGPVIQAGNKFNTFATLDFNPEWVSGAAGNEVLFTSATDAVISHQDLNHGKYSESRNLKWVQKPDGEVVFTAANGLSVTMRFVAPIAGGYRVLYKIPNPTMGDQYVAHDLVAETASAIAEKDVPGRYSFVSSDGVTQNLVTLHKDKTVTGVVGGHWFMDTNGDVVSFECTDLQGKDLTNYADCLATFDTDFSKMSFSHIRRMRFMHKDGNNYEVKYDADVWGARFSVVNRDYFTISWTYRWTRLGDE